MKFWLDLGASGFRVDMAGSLVKNDPGNKETARLWQENRLWLDREFPEAALVSEWSNPSVAIPAGFHMDFLLPFASNAYQSLFRQPDPSGPLAQAAGFFDPGGQGDIRLFLDEYLPLYHATRSQGFISIPSGNHDTTPRLGNGRTPSSLELAFLFLLTMPGVPYLYFGDEIGMRSPAGLKSKEGGYGRTGARTPMQWDGSPNAGFSSAPEAGSLLNRVRQLIALRLAHPALWAGATFEPVFAEEGEFPFVYKRESAGEAIYVAINPADKPCEVTLHTAVFKQPPEVPYGEPAAFSQAGGQWLLRLPPVSGGVYRVSDTF
jgi:maltose alpha-D-glucosyltransferase/alpha-amylase